MNKGRRLGHGHIYAKSSSAEAYLCSLNCCDCPRATKYMGTPIYQQCNNNASGTNSIISDRSGSLYPRHAPDDDLRPSFVIDTMITQTDVSSCPPPRRAIFLMTDKDTKKSLSSAISPCFAIVLP